MTFPPPEAALGTRDLDRLIDGITLGRERHHYCIAPCLAHAAPQAVSLLLKAAAHLVLAAQQHSDGANLKCCCQLLPPARTRGKPD